MWRMRSKTMSFHGYKRLECFLRNPYTHTHTKQHTNTGKWRWGKKRNNVLCFEQSEVWCPLYVRVCLLVWCVCVVVFWVVVCRLVWRQINTIAFEFGICVELFLFAWFCIHFRCYALSNIDLILWLCKQLEFDYKYYVVIVVVYFLYDYTTLS